MMMESGEIKMRFGRCPYCRTMIYQNPEAAIFFCSKCRTPIRDVCGFLASLQSAGKNTVPTEEIDQALSRHEILSVDTASVFSDELESCHSKLAPGVDLDGDQPLLFHHDIIAPPRSSAPAPDGGFGSVRRRHSLSNGAPSGARCDDGFADSIDQDRLRPFSRRTRRPSGSDSDSSVLRYGMLMTTDSEAEEGFSSPWNACERRRLRPRRRSLLGSQAFETPIGSSGQEPYGVAPSPLRDPAFSNDLVNALDNLRGLIAAAIEPASSSSRRASAPRDAHLFRQLESQLARARALHIDGRGHRRNASSTGSSLSSSGGYRSERRKNHCRPVMGGAPFLVCGSCSELLQAPATTGLPREKVVRLRCGGCEEVLEMTAVTAGAGGSAPHKKTRALSPPPIADPCSCNSGAGACRDGAQPLPPQPLHRALGYSSPSPLLQSRRY
ncbi:uncharacterized protein LOC8064137 isoform X1 [Sorghum bicolor]|uniref:Probable zinc-ribbon domain-containing protein n=1 Tax=Sorghum bicolor TaxID=4558 RepID=A0A1Z5R3T9_SORBI|nr:uncharacterized protein LOC8064137 isoform X1 [Sorghum bicolor]XP_021303953.1 uncharacterized protein LOC8064137 isoform X1 [Sorghum bicolor]OQU78187.1 hypothetical protein SORBI_3009G174400 [Sorghum bicolor]OQU78188.1 hypothetical protein SORBI_3009G174400 [Sorghum bicolor]OQU78189.1 hypothetical protein SORBI_3009G174400 [Sorghum bicolor]|eukprot:XP_021303952.1 uncharacterized protein LOC8064137 isoform X1 [Sorghum bicolor]